MNPTMLCLDFDGTILRYEDPPEHIHPDIVAALNTLGDAGIEWMANSGRTMEGQYEILQHTARTYGLRHWPSAILHSECFIHRRENGRYISLDAWNTKAQADMLSVQQVLNSQCKETMNRLIRTYAPMETQFLDVATVFHMAGDEMRRQSFIADLHGLLSCVPHAQLIQNGEWISIIHANVGKGHLLRAYMDHRKISPDHVLAVGDHGNDISMLDGTVTPHVACPGNAYGPTQDAVRRAGGYVAKAHGPVGSLEAFRHYFPELVGST